jgi:hypothetical protein
MASLFSMAKDRLLGLFKRTSAQAFSHAFPTLSMLINHSEAYNFLTITPVATL